jgi:hypothetical protein
MESMSSDRASIRTLFNDEDCPLLAMIIGINVAAKQTKKVIEIIS